MHRNILVTGGAGFIGSHLVAALLRDNPACKIWVLDNLHPQVHGTNAKPPNFPDAVTFIHEDIADKGAVQSAVALAQPELVYHLAAETGTGQSYDEVVRYCDVNVTGTAYLIEALRRHSLNCTKRVVLAASRAVYGEGGYKDADGRIYVGLPRQSEAMAAGDFAVPMPAEAKLPASAVPSEASLPPAPASVYASTKLMQEYLLKQAGEGASWKSTILRFQNVYGPGQSLRNPYTGVLSIFARQLLEGKTLAIYEDGMIARDFVYVDDVVHALVKAGWYDLPSGITIDIGSGKPASILEIACLLMRHLDCTNDKYTVTGQFRAGDIRHACADIRSACDQLQWEPKVSIEAGLLQLATWARSEFQSNSL
jgi:dTDP-L-rhamnose 4-epimerase